MSMKKEDELVELAAKKFLQQKGEEFRKFLMYLILGIFVPFGIGFIGCIIINEKLTQEIELKYSWVMEWLYFWVWGIFGLICIGLIVLIICLLYTILKSWITSNIEKAIKEAKKELRIK